MGAATRAARCTGPTALVRAVDPLDDQPSSRAALVETVRRQVTAARYRPEAESVAEALLWWSLGGPDASPGHLAHAS